MRAVWCCVASLLLMASVHSANAAKYEILFEEGAFQYDPRSTPENVNNKYLARVTVKKDGYVVAKDLRGSTLPDAWVFYQHWNAELKHADPPSDADVIAMFEHFAKQTTTLRGSNAKLGETHLADIADILDVLNRVPAIKSGEYPFVMGLHKGGQSVHGYPYVPRLLGGTQDKPYDPSDSSSKADIRGGFIRTLNKNNAQNQKHLADGINVHDGRTTRDYKDSEGCLTLRPEDWNAFYSVLPPPQEWTNYGHIGVVFVRRAAPLPAPTVAPSPPANLLVQ